MLICIRKKRYKYQTFSTYFSTNLENKTLW